MANEKFQNALKAKAQAVPPVWFMRQAGRYHKHYQALKQKHTFMELCKNPELACETTMGPIEDFDFDVAILFSDLLFPIEALGLGLRYDPGPKFDRALIEEDLSKLKSTEAALKELQFQKEALQLIRKRLPEDKSLIGFVGGPWTLFSYAAGGGHDGNLIHAKTQIGFYQKFCEVLLPLLTKNIQLQLEGGAEVVMIFDTAAGELSPAFYNEFVVPHLLEIAKKFPQKVAYYSKTTQMSHLAPKILGCKDWAGLGVDHRWDLPAFLKTSRGSSFVQGNFDQALLFMKPQDFERELRKWLAPFLKMSPAERTGWICGLGHGVLPQTPEENVRNFVKIVREVFGT